MAKIAGFFSKNCVFLKNHHYYSNCLRKTLLVSIDTKFYGDYFAFEHLLRKIDIFTVKCNKKGKCFCFKPIFFSLEAPSNNKNSKEGPPPLI